MKNKVLHGVSIIVGKLKKINVGKILKADTDKKSAERNSDKGRLKKRTLKFKLISSFLVPIAFIIILGSVSYLIAKKNIQEQYEDSSTNNVISMSRYYDLLCSTVEYNANQILNNEYFTAYYTKYYAKNDSKSRQYYSDAKNPLKSMRGSLSYIYSYTVLPENGSAITSTSEVFDNSVYKKFVGSEKSAYIRSNEDTSSIWTGYHSFLDEFKAIDENSYALSFTKKFIKGNGYLFIDIKTDYIADTLSQTAFGEKNITGLVTSDGRETVVRLAKDGKTYETVDNVFTGLGIYNKIKDTKEAGSRYITYKGDQYLFVYAPVGDKNLMVCSIIPKSVILKKVAEIRNTTIIIVIFASFIALFIGNVIANGISSEVRRINRIMGKIAEGDLTVEFKTKRQDEFRILSEGMETMLNGTSGLVLNMQGFGGNVSEAAMQVSDSAGTMVDSMTSTTTAIGEITKAIISQAESTEKGFQMMENFSEQLNEIYNSTDRMGQTADRAIQSLDRGQKMMDDLNVKSAATTKITQVLIEDINEVYLQSGDIGGIVNAINEIASRTNLLSLNASIEAARAGEYGRGFSVVAEEIRKLAEQSVESSNKIKKIVDNIQKTTSRTSDSARQAGGLMEHQINSLEDTICVFVEINKSVEDLVTALRDNAVRMVNMMTDKKEILGAIQDIAAVSEEAAATTEEVQATIDEQLSSVKQLAVIANRLNFEVGSLEASLKQFKTE